MPAIAVLGGVALGFYAAIRYLRSGPSSVRTAQLLESVAFALALISVGLELYGLAAVLAVAGIVIAVQVVLRRLRGASPRR